MAYPQDEYKGEWGQGSDEGVMAYPQDEYKGEWGQGSDEGVMAYPQDEYKGEWGQGSDEGVMAYPQDEYKGEWGQGSDEGVMAYPQDEYKGEQGQRSEEVGWMSSNPARFKTLPCGVDRTKKQSSAKREVCGFSSSCYTVVGCGGGGQHLQTMFIYPANIGGNGGGGGAPTWS
ncbi:Hypothetical predicted protein [Octopus vulgaris]|uniref:Uncharacterized protein n=1 Tax=Octopus vulgaris TaxID=6645 RepID=A0AA36BWK9_OCTVU|nr:Hypothetical predicted protein [Octopus vulgaris]